MALPILDGNQSATTLSTILSSGQHITAHTVVSLGTQAITDIVNATSAGLTNTQLRASAVTVGGTVTVGNSVTISSLPAISGTVTVGQIQGYQHTTATTSGPYSADVIIVGEDIEAGKAGALVIVPTARGGNVLGGRTSQGDTPICVYGDNGSAVTISGTVTANPTGTQTIAGSVTLGAGTAQIGSVTASISNFPATQAISIASVTIGSLPLIAGTVTANLAQGIISTSDDVGSSAPKLVVGVFDAIGTQFGDNKPFPISGTVTIGSLPAISGTVTANTFALQGTAVTTSVFTSTTASTVLAGFNAGRQVLTIFNEGASNLFVCGGATCTTIAYQVRLSAGDYYEVPNHQTTITHSAVFQTAGTARVTEVS